MLTAALVVARRYCGWHVSPVNLGQSVTLDGPGSKVLWLPTRNVVTLTSVTEDGTLLDLTTIAMSRGDGPGTDRRPVALRKKTCPKWWTCNYSGLVVVMDNGFTEAQAADWRQAVLSMVDQMSQMPVLASIGQSPIGMRTKDIDDVRYQWQPQYGVLAENVIFSVTNILDDYQLPTVEFF